MKSPLHILHLEDDPNDAALVQASLEADGIDCVITRVETRGDFIAKLEDSDIDLIVSDYSLPKFDGLSALKIARDGWPTIPLILVSGTLGEEFAVDTLKNGATDYVLKERLARLGPAVRRAMLDVEADAERRRLEVNAIEAQKMEVVGQLASGVAHDFNNILAVIMGYGDLIASKLPNDSPLREYAEQIRLASKRAVALTRQLLVFSRKDKVLTVVLNIDSVVKDLHKMLLRLVHENIEVEIVAGEGIGRIKADSGYVGQVLMNLVVNSRDAMPAGGKLIIATSNGTIEEGSALAGTGANPGDYVLLSVSDTGTGMTEHVKAHLFEAFFTTKPDGKGTGLGLATCKTIVQQSGGYIDVVSKVGQGTTFTVYFPRVEMPMAMVAIAPVAGPMPRGTETLLVVEDEPSVRHLAWGVLEAQGYEVLTAGNGQDGLNVARNHRGAPIRLVITDIIMPLMSGLVMAEWMKTTYPDLKVLFTSGYTEETIAAQDVLKSGVAFLPKPYTPSALTCRVREMLDTPQTLNRP